MTILKKYFFWVFVALMAFIPLYPKFPLLSVAGTYVSIRLEDFLIGFTFLYWFIINLQKIKSFLKLPIFQAFLLFWGLGLLSLMSAILITQSVVPHLGLLHFLRRIEYMSFFVIAATTISSLRQVKIVLLVGAITTLVVIAYGFGQQWLNFPVISTTNKEFSKGLVLFLTQGARINSTFAGHYDLAIFLMMVLTILSSLFFGSKRFIRKVLILGLGLLSFILLGLTAARVTFAATLIGLVLGFWFNGKRILIGVLILCSILAVGIIPDLRHRLVATFTVGILGGGGPKYIPSQSTPLDPSKRLSEEDRKKILDEAKKTGGDKASNISTVSADIAPGEPINSTELEVYRSSGIRFNVEWPRAINAFLKNPLLGTGYSSLTIATDNDLLRSLGEVGLLGTLAFALIFFAVFKKMFRFISVKTDNFFEKKIIIGILASTIGLLITATFIDVFEASKVATIFWFILGLGWAVMSQHKVGNNEI